MSLLEQTIAVIQPASQETATDAAARLQQVLEGDAAALGQKSARSSPAPTMALLPKESVPIQPKRLCR